MQPRTNATNVAELSFGAEEGSVEDEEGSGAELRAPRAHVLGVQPGLHELVRAAVRPEAPQLGPPQPVVPRARRRGPLFR